MNKIDVGVKSGEMKIVMAGDGSGKSKFMENLKEKIFICDPMRNCPNDMLLSQHIESVTPMPQITKDEFINGLNKAMKKLEIGAGSGD